MSVPPPTFTGSLVDRADHLRLDTAELEDSVWVDAAGVRAALAGDGEAPFVAPPPFAIAHSLLLHWLAAAAAPA